MKSKTILGADGTTKMRQITVGIHGKGGETGIKAVMLLTALINDLKQCKTPQEVYDGYLQITGCIYKLFSYLITRFLLCLCPCLFIPCQICR